MEHDTERKSSIISGVFGNMFIVQIMIQLIGIIGNVADGMVTGRFLGEDAITAYGFSTTVIMVIAIAGSVMSLGNSMMCSRYLGEGDLRRTKKVFSACFTAALIVSAVLGLMIFSFPGPISGLLGAKDGLIPLTADYLRGYAIAGPGIILTAFLMPIMQMDGQMKRLLLAVAVMTVGDIAADLINVTIVHGGMFGMAIATAVSYYLALLVLLPHFLRKDVIFTKPSLAIDVKTSGEMLTGGMPGAVSQCGRLLITFILNRLLMVHSGSAAVGANAVIMSAGNLCLVPGSAICDTVQILTGVLCGEEDRKGIIRMVRSALKYCVLVNITLILVFQLGAAPFIGLFFSESPDTEALAVAGFRFYVLCMVFYSVNGLYRNFCQGSGQFRRSFIISAADCFLFPFLTALVLVFSAGIPAVWLCYVIGEGLLTLVIMLYFRKKNAECSGVEALIPFPEHFGRDILAVMDFSISENNMDRVMKKSRSAESFCREQGADQRTAFYMALFIEEAVGNVIEHGFADGRNHCIDIRILRKKDGWILRMRDDCPLFDPNKYLEQYDDTDPCGNIGLKMLRGMSSNIVYLNTLSLNNLIIYL